MSYKKIINIKRLNNIDSYLDLVNEFLFVSIFFFYLNCFSVLITCFELLDQFSELCIHYLTSLLIFQWNQSTVL